MTTPFDDDEEETTLVVGNLPFEAPESWGEWSLGDYPTLLQRAADILGPSNEVEMVTVGTPDHPVRSLPHVLVTVSSPRAVARLKEHADDGRFRMMNLMTEDTQSWTAVISGMVLSVEWPEGVS